MSLLTFKPIVFLYFTIVGFSSFHSFIQNDPLYNRKLWGQETGRWWKTMNIYNPSRSINKREDAKNGEKNWMVSPHMKRVRDYWYRFTYHYDIDITDKRRFVFLISNWAVSFWTPEGRSYEFSHVSQSVSDAIPGNLVQ